ncbi:MAG: ABC transporter permease subunit, partial [Pikeienuella sp.]
MRAVLILAALAVALILPFFVYPVLLMTILCFVVFATSFNLLLGYVGLLCFGQAMFLGLAAYVAGHLLKTTGLTLELTILAGGLVSAALGALVGYVAVRRSGIQFAMITFAFAQFV